MWTRIPLWSQETCRDKRRPKVTSSLDCLGPADVNHTPIFIYIGTTLFFTRLDHDETERWSGRHLGYFEQGVWEKHPSCLFTSLTPASHHGDSIYYQSGCFKGDLQHGVWDGRKESRSKVFNLLIQSESCIENRHHGNKPLHYSVQKSKKQAS